MPLTPTALTRNHVAPSSGDAFVVFTGYSGVFQPMMVVDSSGQLIDPASETTLQQVSRQLSGLNIAKVSGIVGGRILVDAAQSGVWFLSNNSFQAGQSGQWVVALTGNPNVTVLQPINTFAGQSGNWDIRNINYLSGGQIGVTGQVSLAGTISVDQIGLSGGNLQVGQSGNWYITSSLSNPITGSVSVSSLPAITVVQPLNVNAGQSGNWYNTVSLANNITGNLGLNNGGAVTLTGAPDVRITGSVTLNTGVVSVSVTNTPTVAFNNASIQAGQSGAWTVILTGTNSITANLGTNSMVGISGQTLVQVTPSGTFNVTVNAALPAGTNTIGNVGFVNQSIQVGQSGAWPVNLTGLNQVNITGLITASVVPSGSFAVAITGTPNVNVSYGTVSLANNISGSISSVPITSNGLSIYRSININTTGASIKNAAGQLYGYFLYNNSSSVRFVKIYDITGAPVVGTNVPVMTIPLPFSGGANLSLSCGISFTSGIGIGASNLIADSDTTLPSPNDVIANVFYK